MSAVLRTAVSDTEGVIRLEAPDQLYLTNCTCRVADDRLRPTDPTWSFLPLKSHKNVELSAEPESQSSLLLMLYTFDRVQTGRTPANAIPTLVPRLQALTNVLYHPMEEVALAGSIAPKLFPVDEAWWWARSDWAWVRADWVPCDSCGRASSRRKTLMLHIG